MRLNSTLLHLTVGLLSSLAAGAACAQQAQQPQAAANPTAPKLVTGPTGLLGKSVDELQKSMEQLSADKTKPDFTPEKLKPVGGTLSLPRGWLLYEQHNERSYIWMATMPPPNQQSRGEARFRIMLQPQMLKTEKRKPSIHTATQVQELVKAHPDIKACEPTRVGPWVKVCYEYEYGQAQGDETTPTKFHVRASLYYSDALDLFAMTMFSTPADKWTKYADIMAKMDQLEFFDVSAAAQGKTADKAADKPADKTAKDKPAAKK